MAKADIVKQGVGLLQASQEDVLGQFYDLAAADVKASEPAPLPVDASVQDQIDAAVAPLKSQLASMQSDLDQAKSDLAASKSDDDADKAKIAEDEAKNEKLQSMLDKIQAIFAAVSAPADSSQPAPAQA